MRMFPVTPCYAFLRNSFRTLIARSDPVDSWCFAVIIGASHDVQDVNRVVWEVPVTA